MCVIATGFYAKAATFHSRGISGADATTRCMLSSASLSIDGMERHLLIRLCVLRSHFIYAQEQATSCTVRFTCS